MYHEVFSFIRGIKNRNGKHFANYLNVLMEVAKRK